MGFHDRKGIVHQLILLESFSTGWHVILAQLNASLLRNFVESMLRTMQYTPLRHRKCIAMQFSHRTQTKKDQNGAATHPAITVFSLLRAFYIGQSPLPIAVEEILFYYTIHY